MRVLGIELLGLAVVFDVTMGEPPAAVHPVVWMGRAIAACERLITARSRLAQFAAGVAMAVCIPALVAFAAWHVDAVIYGHPVLGIVVGAFLLKTTFALAALVRAARAVRDAVAQGRIDEARTGLRALCSRDAGTLTAPELVAATIESLAENASDSFVAPLFWFAIGGLPGAMFYRAVNTLDAMIGYRGRYEWLGKAAARLDDAMNFVPARLTAWLLISGGALAGFDVLRGWRVLARDGALTESPNAGRPMAAMAGLLGLELAKAGHYRLGDAVEALEAGQIDRASRVTLFASVLAVALTTAILEGRSVLAV